MSLKYSDLDRQVRGCMLQELEQDINNDRLYISPRLTSAGSRSWPTMMREAIARHDDAWLATELRARGYLRDHEHKRKPVNDLTTAKVPVTGPDLLAEGEFNRFYIRGVCADVLAAGGSEVEVYRGKQVKMPRPVSEKLIGQRLSAWQLLEDSRSAPNNEPVTGLPAGPNSGLTVKRV